MIHAAITSLNSSEKGHKIPMTSFGQLSGCQGSLTVAIPAPHLFSYLSVSDTLIASHTIPEKIFSES